MTVWHFIIFGFLAIEVCLDVRDIRRLGFRAWFRNTAAVTGFQGLAKRFPPRLRVVGPAAVFLVLMFCLIQISLHKK